jgi:predicted nucleotide-binding protein
LSKFLIAQLQRHLDSGMVMDTQTELTLIIENLLKVEGFSSNSEVSHAIEAITKTGKEFAGAFSGSWLGYHSRVYYKDFQRPPPGAHFSQEWGLNPSSDRLGSKGSWKEYDCKTVKDAIKKRAGNPDLQKVKAAERESTQLLQLSKDTLESILVSILSKRDDEILRRCKEELENYGPLTPYEIYEVLSPSGQIMTSDTIVLGQGTQVPPHIEVQSEALSAKHVFANCAKVKNIAIKVASHLKRSINMTAQAKGSFVFIGHGGDPAWKELKDFLSERLSLKWDEFNRVPVAGMSNKERLTEMLNNASFAFLVLTAEDERSDGVIQARENVLHETGLFQGKLGFNRAIILLEDGCNEFTNIAGLGQIRFAKGQLSAKFEEIRRVLEREGIVG